MPDPTAASWAALVAHMYGDTEMRDEREGLIGALTQLGERTLDAESNSGRSGFWGASVLAAAATIRADAARIAELEAALSARDAEVASFRAVLEGAEYADIDSIAKNSVAESRALGELVRSITKGIIAERNVLRAALNPGGPDE